MEMLGQIFAAADETVRVGRRAARRRAHDSRRGTEVRARRRRHAFTRTESGRSPPHSPATRVYVTKPLGTGLIMSGHKKGAIGTQQLERAVGWMKTLNKDAADVLRVAHGQRGDGRDRLRALRPRARDGRSKRRPDHARVGALPRDRRGARPRPQGRPHERRPAQPRLRRPPPDAERACPRRSSRSATTRRRRAACSSSLPSEQGPVLEAEFTSRRLFLRRVGTVEEGSGVVVE